MGKARAKQLTTADLVLLSLLAERRMHGYQANAELERREARDWAGISRPQIYYSLEKLAELRFLKAERAKGKSAGPERQTYSVTAKGKIALASALEKEHWCVQRERPAFLTWMALSWQAGKEVFERQLERRRKFLTAESDRERKTLAEILKEVGHPYHEAVWMVELMISGFENELRWLARVASEANLRGRARNPAIIE